MKVTEASVALVYDVLRLPLSTQGLETGYSSLEYVSSELKCINSALKGMRGDRQEELRDSAPTLEATVLTEPTLKIYPA